MLRPLALYALLCCLHIPVLAFTGRVGVYDLSERHERTSFSDHESIHQPPRLDAPIGAIEQRFDKGQIRIDLNKVFSDPEERPLTFSFRPTRTDIAVLSIDKGILIIDPISRGEAEIRVIAKDVDNRRTRDTFVLTIRDNAPPYLSSQAKFQDQELKIGQRSYSIYLPGTFIDPDLDPLDYSVSTSNSNVSQPTIANDILTVPALQPGSTTITITANDGEGGESTTSFQTRVIRAYPSKVLITIDKQFESYEEQSSYRLIALPGIQEVNIQALATGQPLIDWVAYVADTLEQGRVKLYDGSDDFVFQPGKGMWFLQKEDWVLPYRQSPTVTLAKDGSYSVPLHPGWNIISNPFEVDIPWGHVVFRNDITQSAWDWDGSYTRVDTLYSAQRDLQAFYYNNAENLDSLILPHPYFSTVRSVGKTTRQPTHPFTLSVQDESGREASIRIGADAASETGFDAFDLFAPPSHFSDLNLLIAGDHPDFKGQQLAQEYRPFDENVTRFNIALTTSEANSVQLSTEGLEHLGVESAVLIDLLNTRTYNLHDQDIVSIHVEKPVTSFALLAGAQEAVNDYAGQLTPTKTVLYSNYPNPFFAFTTFEFALENQQYVDFSVFDAMGRRVATLFEGIKEAGLHQVTWHGYDYTSRRVANGVYFYRLKAGEFEKTKKLILLQ